MSINSGCHISIKEGAETACIEKRKRRFIEGIASSDERLKALRFWSNVLSGDEKASVDVSLREEEGLNRGLFTKVISPGLSDSAINGPFGYEHPKKPSLSVTPFTMATQDTTEVLSLFLKCPQNSPSTSHANER